MQLLGLDTRVALKTPFSILSSRVGVMHAHTLSVSQLPSQTLISVRQLSTSVRKNPCLDLSTGVCDPRDQHWRGCRKWRIVCFVPQYQPSCVCFIDQVVGSVVLTCLHPNLDDCPSTCLTRQHPPTPNCKEKEEEEEGKKMGGGRKTWIVFNKNSFLYYFCLPKPPKFSLLHFSLD